MSRQTNYAASTFVDVPVPHPLNTVPVHLASSPVALVHVTLAPHECSFTMHHSVFPFALVPISAHQQIQNT